MTIDQAIRKALEGGFSPTYWDRTEIGANQLHRSEVNTIFLDPSFWQSLGKALDWKNREYNMSTVGKGDTHVQQFGWKAQWHHFIDHLAEGDDADTFFRNLG